MLFGRRCTSGKRWRPCWAPSRSCKEKKQMQRDRIHHASLSPAQPDLTEIVPAAATGLIISFMASTPRAFFFLSFPFFWKQKRKEPWAIVQCAHRRYASSSFPRPHLVCSARCVDAANGAVMLLGVSMRIIAFGLRTSEQHCPVLFFFPITAANRRTLTESQRIALLYSLTSPSLVTSFNHFYNCWCNFFLLPVVSF